MHVHHEHWIILILLNVVSKIQTWDYPNRKMRYWGTIKVKQNYYQVCCLPNDSRYILGKDLINSYWNHINSGRKFNHGAKASKLILDYLRFSYTNWANPTVTLNNFFDFVVLQNIIEFNKVFLRFNCRINSETSMKKKWSRSIQKLLWRYRIIFNV
jgi:hypothetical protein